MSRNWVGKLVQKGLSYFLKCNFPCQRFWKKFPVQGLNFIVSWRVLWYQREMCPQAHVLHHSVPYYSNCKCIRKRQGFTGWSKKKIKQPWPKGMLCIRNYLSFIMDKLCFYMSTTVSPPSSSFSSKSLPNFPSSPKTNKQQKLPSKHLRRTSLTSTLCSLSVYTHFIS